MAQTGLHILIGFAEALPAPEVFFSLHDAGHRISVFAREGVTAPLARHVPLEQVHFIPAPETDAKAAEALTALMQGPDAPDFILPIDDAALWLINKAMTFAPERVAGVVGPQAAFSLDKTQQVEAARIAGLPLPETFIIRTPDDLKVDMPFPVIAKPALAVAEQAGRIGKDGVEYLQDRAAADALAAKLDTDMDPLLVQPLVAGIGEGVFGFAGPQGVTHWSGHRRLRMMNPHGSGSSACISSPPTDEIREASTRFLESINWRGPFMIELLRDAQGTPWFMELNGRMWGSMALARGQGLEYPAWAVAQAQDPTFIPPAVSLSDTPLEAQHLGRDILHLLLVLRGPRDPFYKAHWPRFLHSLKAVLWGRGSRRRYNHHPKFPRLAWADAFYTVKSAVIRKKDS
ncbi:MAG: hypothetical protein ABJ327_13120 [Litoreibacter sp.]